MCSSGAAEAATRWTARWKGPGCAAFTDAGPGSRADFRYSEALKNAKITWNEDPLDKWLTDTEALVPDNDMSFRVPSPEERRDIIAYLKSLFAWDNVVCQRTAMSYSKRASANCSSKPWFRI